IGYQADSSEDYENLIETTENIEQLSENIVGGRRVGIFKTNFPLNYQDQVFSVIEIIEPKKDQQVNSAWEHVEFLIDKPLEELVSDYPHVNWEISAINREEFPMLILDLGDGIRVKFPRLGVLDELKRQENLN